MNMARPIIAALALCAATAVAAAAPARGPATMKELMKLVIEPASNGVFQAAGEAPKSEAQWSALQGQALTLVEIAGTLTATNRSKAGKQWSTDVKAFQLESKKAFDAAMAKDATAFEALSDSLYTTCANCHEHFVPKK